MYGEDEEAPVCEGRYDDDRALEIGGSSSCTLLAVFLNGKDMGQVTGADFDAVWMMEAG